MIRKYKSRGKYITINDRHSTFGQREKLYNMTKKQLIEENETSKQKLIMGKVIKMKTITRV